MAPWIESLILTAPDPLAERAYWEQMARHFPAERDFDRDRHELEQRQLAACEAEEVDCARSERREPK